MSEELPYNGSTALVNKIEHLLAEKKLSTAAAMRLLLEKELADIKINHARDLQIKELKAENEEIKRHSTGWWIHNNKKMAFTIALILLSLVASDVKIPIMQWFSEVIGLIIKAL
jgi:hypothetical protein